VIEQILISEEETQIAGVIGIFDLTKFPKRLLTFLTISEIKNMIYLLGHVMPIRLRAIYIVGLPSFASQIFEIGSGLMNKKLKNRITLLKDYEALKNYVDVDLLPLEFGGKIPIQEMIRGLGDDLMNCREDILLINDVDVDLYGHTKNPNRIGTRPTENFRKLEFD
jgi:hypothetical protein